MRHLLSSIENASTILKDRLLTKKSSQYKYLTDLPILPKLLNGQYILEILDDIMKIPTILVEVNDSHMLLYLDHNIKDYLEVLDLSSLYFKKIVFTSLNLLHGVRLISYISNQISLYRNAILIGGIPNTDHLNSFQYIINYIRLINKLYNKEIDVLINTNKIEFKNECDKYISSYQNDLMMSIINFSFTDDQIDSEFDKYPHDSLVYSSRKVIENAYGNIDLIDGI